MFQIGGAFLLISIFIYLSASFLLFELFCFVTGALTELCNVLYAKPYYLLPACYISGKRMHLNRIIGRFFQNFQCEFLRFSFIQTAFCLNQRCVRFYVTNHAQNNFLDAELLIKLPKFVRHGVRAISWQRSRQRYSIYEMALFLYSL